MNATVRTNTFTCSFTFRPSWLFPNSSIVSRVYPVAGCGKRGQRLQADTASVFFGRHCFFSASCGWYPSQLLPIMSSQNGERSGTALTFLPALMDDDPGEVPDERMPPVPRNQSAQQTGPGLVTPVRWHPPKRGHPSLAPEQGDIARPRWGCPHQAAPLMPANESPMASAFHTGPGLGRFQCLAVLQQLDRDIVG